MTRASWLWVWGLGLLPAVAHADGDFYCDAKIIAVGHTAFRVQSLCGPPDGVQQRMEQRTVRRRIKVPCRVGICETFVAETVEVEVLEWIYDFGTRRFMQYLTFENGTLVRVRSGAYGHKSLTPPPDAPPSDPVPPPPAAPPETPPAAEGG